MEPCVEGNRVRPKKNTTDWFIYTCLRAGGIPENSNFKTVVNVFFQLT